MTIFPGGRSRDRGASATPDGQKAWPADRISCHGPFRFDFMANVATFKDQVDVKRENASGPSDQLNCQLLSMFFEATTPPGAASPGAATAETEKTASNLQPVRLEADGSPVTVHAHSNGTSARGQQSTTS